MNPILSWFCKIFLGPLVKLLFIKEVRGWENVPKRNFILVSNHQSYIDIIIDGYLCVPRSFHFIGQIDGFKGILKFIIQSVYSLSGVIPLNRKSDASRENAVKMAIEVLKKGDILVIYPEGRRSASGVIQEGKFGTARIFLKTGVPIIPAGIIGTFELMPPLGKLRIKRIVRINIGKPLFFQEELAIAQNLNENSEEYLKMVQKITDKTMEEIEKLI